MNTKKGAYFFVVDAFIAGLIITASIAVFFTTISIQDDPAQNFLLAENFMSLLETTNINQYSGEALYPLIVSGFLRDTTVSLLETVPKLFYASPPTSDTLPIFLDELSNLAPEHLGIGFYLHDVTGENVLFEWIPPLIEQESSRSRLSAHRVVYVQDSGDIIFLEVRLWQ